MTEQEKNIIQVAVEIDRLLTNGIQIKNNHPIHEKLNRLLQQFGLIAVKDETSKEVVDHEWFNKC